MQMNEKLAMHDQFLKITHLQALGLCISGQFNKFVSLIFLK